MRKTLTALMTLVGVCFTAAAIAQAVPADIVYPNAMLGNTTFSHSTHVTDHKLACAECHPTLFGMTKGAKITMADMNAGKNCGACHKAGAKAFPATDCAKCHKK